MKAIYIIVMFLTILKLSLIKAHNSDPSNWILDIKNENYTDDLIELRPGVLKKIILSIRHQTSIINWDKDSIDKVNFTIASKDPCNIILYPNKYLYLIPYESFDYIIYVGLSCNHQICSTEYDLDFTLIEKRFLDGKYIDNVNLIINPIKIKINNNPTLIDIEPIETIIPARSYSLFKLKNEIYNIEGLTIKPEGCYSKEKFEIETIYIKSFKDRKILNKEIIDDNGILFDQKFGVLSDYQGLDGETNIAFSLALDYSNQNKRKCFEINPKYKNVNLVINKQDKIFLNYPIKEALLNSIENITPEKDKTNNIQVKINLPVSPVLIECDLYGDGEDEEQDIIHYKDYILNSGIKIIKFNNLNSNNEYKGKCIFSSATFPASGFTITMGNEKDKEFISPLFPSKSLYGQPQCLEYKFTSTNLKTLEEQIEKFSELILWFCNTRMIYDENNRIYTIKKNFICEIPELENADKKNNKVTICIGPSPSHTTEIIEEDIEKLKAYYIQQIDNIINSTYPDNALHSLFYGINEINDLKLEELNRYYDSSKPDLNKIKLEVVTDDGLAKKEKLKFKIKSNNTQAIECFYNSEMKVEDQKKYINLYHNKEDSTSIILYPNEEKSFETYLKGIKDKSMFSLYMNCYNLPGAKIRYQQTGVFNAYTYLYTDIEEDQSVFEEKNDNITINCVEVNNRKNPKCLKGTYNNLNNMLKTKIPETDENEELEKFSKLSESAKNDLLDEIFKNFDQEIGNLANSSQIINKLIINEKFLINRDCSIYANNCSNENDSLNEINNEKYENCRENKKIKQKKIIEYLKNNFNCNKLSLLISQEGISNNVEQNIKYIILLIEEVTNNADSFEKGDSEVLLNIITCLQDNYEVYWNQVKEYLENKRSLNIIINAIKKDISNLLIYSMANLVKVLHFDEIDNYLSEKEKNITNGGLMASKQGKQIHKSIKQFVKNYNEFGDGLYNLSDSLIINITINNDFKEKSSKEEKEIDDKAIKFEDKGIILLLKPQSMMKQFNAYAMQVISYESPLVPIETDDDKNEIILNTFISINLYDNKGNEIKIDEIPEEIRPKILYDKEYHKYIKSCYFYNEEIEDLSGKGVSIEYNYTYDGSEYLKCTTEHLTCFTVGNYYNRTRKTTETSTNNDNSGILKEKDLIRLYLLGSIFAFILLLVCVICIVKKKRKDKYEKKKNSYNIELEAIGATSSD